MTRIGRLCTIAAWTVGVLGAAAAPVCAQAAPPPVAVSNSPAVDVLFADASAKEAAVRKALAAEPTQTTLLKAVRTVVADYETVVRRYPASGYCDDALWRAAGLAREAFEAFGEARERATALRLLKLLSSGYPASRLAKAAPEQIAWLEAHPAKVGSPPSAATASSATNGPPLSVGTTSPGSSASAASGPSTPVVREAAIPVASASTNHAAKLVNIKAIRRAVMKDLVRIVIELDDEVAFHDERIDGPSRVFVDLSSTRANPALIDHTLRFDSDTDVVRQIRIGRHPNAVTRVVLEASGVSSYSVYPLYSPFRLVIDCLRSTPEFAEATPGGIPDRPPAAATTAPAGAMTAAAVRPPRSTATSTGQLLPGAPPIGVPVPPPVAHAAEPSAPAPAPAPAPSPAPAALAVPGAASADAPKDNLPAWATTLKKEPPVLAATRVRWVLPLPRMTAPVLPGVSAVAGRDASDAGQAKASSDAAPKAPSKNLAGGLSIARQLGLGVSRIVIDPGHGGHDPGAKGPGVTEADLVLDVALRLEKLLNKVPGVEVVLTRRENEFISLQERTAIANRESADLFLSIHANASSVASARGIETYFLNFAQNQSAAAVAARENATSGQTMGSLQDVIKAIALNTKVDESRDFATYVQREMLASLKGANSGLKDLGVKQAPFVVLIGAAMPSILAEISFVTNPQEARLLKSQGYRQKIAEALLEGVRKYQRSLKNGAAVAAQQQN